MEYMHFTIIILKLLSYYMDKALALSSPSNSLDFYLTYRFMASSKKSLWSTSMGTQSGPVCCQNFEWGWMYVQCSWIVHFVLGVV